MRCQFYNWSCSVLQIWRPHTLSSQWYHLWTEITCCDCSRQKISTNQTTHHTRIRFCLKSKRQCNDNSIATSIKDLRGDIIIKGLFERNQDCIINVPVTNMDDAPSYRTRNPFSVIKSQETEKKKKNISSTLPRAADICALCCVYWWHNREGVGRSLLKQLSLRLADKWRKPISVVAGIVWSRMSFAILWASNYCIWGSRTPFHKVSREIQQWDGSSGTALYVYEISD